MFLTAPILGVALLTQLLLLTKLFKQERRDAAWYAFSTYIAAIAGWTFSILLTLLTGNSISFHFVYAFAALGITAQLWFAGVFPETYRLPTWVRFAILLGLFFVMASFIPGALFHTVTTSSEGYLLHDNGFLSVPYSLFAVLYIVLPAVMFLRKARKEPDQDRQAQLRYLSAGFAAFLVVSTFTNSVLPALFHIYTFNTIGPVFSLALALTVFVIIWRHQFLNIRIEIERGIVYLLLALLLTGSYFGMLALLKQRFASTTVTPFVAFALLMISGIAIYLIERSFERERALEQERAYAETLERTVAERTKHLEALQAYQTRMTRDLSHELQTPLTVLSGTIARLHREHSIPETAARPLTESTERLSRIITNLLHLSRLEALPTSTKQPVNLSDAASAVTEYVQVICTEQGVQLVTRIEPDITLSGDPAQLEELLNNLLGNAIKYLRPGPERQIELTLARAGDTIELIVRDTGIGIPAAALPHLFERFYRAPGNTEPGTGLGLAIAKRIVELHDGTISIDSVEGSGTTVTVRFSL